MELFFEELNKMNLSESITNTDLKKIIKKIVVNAKNDINVYFNIDFDDYTIPESPEKLLADSEIFFPLYSVFLTDTEYEYRTHRYNIRCRLNWSFPIHS